MTAQPAPLLASAEGAIGRIVLNRPEKLNAFTAEMLSLLEAVCTHVLILKDGEKVADGTMADVHARFSEGADLSLEDVFFRATGEGETPAP